MIDMHALSCFLSHPGRGHRTQPPSSRILGYRREPCHWDWCIDRALARYIQWPRSTPPLKPNRSCKAEESIGSTSGHTCLSITGEAVFASVGSPTGCASTTSTDTYSHFLSTVGQHLPFSLLRGPHPANHTHHDCRFTLAATFTLRLRSLHKRLYTIYHLDFYGFALQVHVCSRCGFSCDEA